MASTTCTVSLTCPITTQYPDPIPHSQSTSDSTQSPIRSPSPDSPSSGPSCASNTPSSPRPSPWILGLTTPSDSGTLPLRVRFPIRRLINPDRGRYTRPSSPQAAIHEACTSIELKGQQTKDELLDGYLNGPRTLSVERLSYLVVSEEGPSFNVLFCATHYIGDGMALHQTANAFFTLLALSEHDLALKLDEEWNTAMGCTQPIPASTESRILVPTSKFQAAAVKVDYKTDQSRLIVRPYPLPMGLS